MKQKKGLFILLGILLVLCAVYFGMRSMNAKKAEEKEAKEKAETIQAVKIKNPVEISYSSDDGKSMEFVKEDGTWYLKNDREAKLQQTALDSIEEQVSDITAERKIKSPDPLESYGLDAPLYTIHIKGEDGTEETVYIGDGANADYYMTTGEKKDVYTVTSSLVNILEFDAENLKEAEESDEGENAKSSGSGSSEASDGDDTSEDTEETE